MDRGRPNVTSPKELRKLLAQYDIRPAKRLGQSFLIDANVVAKTLAAAEIAPDDRVFEVGPGAGALTIPLAARAGALIALELDRRLVELLQRLLGDAPNVRIVQGNILKADLRDLLNGGPWKLLANLPYSIIGPAVARLMRHRGLFSLMLLMVQREVAQRLTAAPGTKAYGVPSLQVQAYAQIEVVGEVSRTCFFPEPQVDSSLVRLTPLQEPPVSSELEPAFTAVVRAVFRQRRKTLVNGLAVAVEFGLTREQAQGIVEAAGIDPMRRPGTLSAEEFAALARAVAIAPGRDFL